MTLSSPDVRPDALSAMLRDLDPPVIARVERDMVWLDMRTILDRDLEALDGGIKQLGRRLTEKLRGVE